MRLLTQFRAALTAWRAAGTPPAPTRVPLVGEKLWLDGMAHVVTGFTPQGHVESEATAEAFDAAHLLPGRRVVRCAQREMVWLEGFRCWVLPGREGPMVNPAQAAKEG